MKKTYYEKLTGAFPEGKSAIVRPLYLIHKTYKQTFRVHIIKKKV